MPPKTGSPEMQLKLWMARVEMDKAKKTYSKQIEQAIAAGMSNRQIGFAVGLTETAIRNWRKRHIDD